MRRIRIGPTLWVRHLNVPQHHSASADERAPPLEPNLEILIGDAASAWLDLPDNIARWQSLYARVENPLPYLSPAYCQVWLNHYSVQHELVLIVGSDAAGDVLGIMPLARIGDDITVVGSHHAEYQGWLCAEDYTNKFFADAMSLLSSHFSRAHVYFKYILSGPQDRSIRAYKAPVGNTQILSRKRPLFAINSVSVTAALKKKSNRSKLNRLKRLGKLELKRVTSASEFQSNIDAIAAAYDFRQGAQNGSCPFFDDPAKRGFHGEWLASCPQDIVFSVLTIDDKPVAAFFGVVIGTTLSNAIVAHHPDVAAHSGSKLHIYLLAEELIDSKITQLDLTPGDDPWKDRFASEYEDVYEFHYWADPDVLRNLERKNVGLGAAKKTLEFASLKPDHVREITSRLARAKPPAIARRIKNVVWDKLEYRIYELPVASIAIEVSGNARINDLGDLVAYDDSVAWSSKQAFLADAAERLSRGERVYSICQAGLLVHFGWMNMSQTSSLFTEVDYRYDYPGAGAVLYDFFTHPTYRGRQAYQTTLQQMLGDISRSEVAPEMVYISALADNGPSRHVIEKLGFRYRESIVRRVNFSRVSYAVQTL